MAAELALARHMGLDCRCVGRALGLAVKRYLWESSRRQREDGNDNDQKAAHDSSSQGEANRRWFL
jgi:hypothetical protein